jgi:hypothetical protein
LIEDFQPHRPLPGDDVRVVVAIDVSEVLPLDERHGVQPGLFDVVAFEQHGGAEVLAVRDLGQRGNARHHDRDGNVQQPPVVSEAQRMIAGGCGDDSAPFLIFRQLKQRVARTAFLETACALEIFQLAVNLAAGRFRKGHRLRTGRALDCAFDALGGGLNVLKRNDHAI